MNRNQWFILGVGLIIFSVILFYEPTSCRMGVDDITSQSNFLACVLHYQIYKIASFVSGFLGVIFTVCGFLEPEKKQ
ncbi:MAG: hypothetical protein KKF68_03890 [Nanoarchaeota archaeon]|nr:hypothetical protein [Nanoarchaeota archaeon]